MVLIVERTEKVPIANKKIEIDRSTAANLLKLTKIGESDAGFKLLARYASRLEDAKAGIDKLVELRDWQALESLAGYAGRIGASKLALNALGKYGQFDEIVNAVYTTRQPEVVRFGVRLLMEKGEIEKLQQEGVARGYGKNAFAAIARELARAIDEIMEMPNNRIALLQIAGSRLEYLQTKAGMDKHPNQEVERVLSAISSVDREALIAIAEKIRDEFLAESKKQMGG